MQLRLPGIDPPGQVQPAADRGEPSIWMRRIRVLRELQPGDEHVVRDVELRRGLNIVWAPPNEPVDGNALFRSGVAGHTAGKTTFCRFVRHALGEGGFASEATRRRIRTKLPSGWVLTEVVVAGTLWTVGRPFGVGPHPFAVEGADIAAALRRSERPDVQRYQDAIEAATTGSLAARRFPARNQDIGWTHVMPWLTRDQECRFADFLVWRHSSSGSDAPSLSDGERQFLVRSVLGLITDAERQEQENNARLVADKKAASQREPLLAHQASVDHARVQRLLGMELQPPSTGLFGSQARAEVDGRRADLLRRTEALAAADNRADLQSTLEQAVQAEALAARDLQDAEDRLKVESAAAAILDAKARGDEQTDLLAALPPSRDYCSVPIRFARERGCPLATSRPVELAAHRSERTAAEELTALREVVRALEERAAELRGVLDEAKTATMVARRAFMAAATAYDEERGRLLDEEARIRQSERLVDDAEDAWNQSAGQAELVRTIAAQVEASYTRQEELRQSARQALGRFSATFDYVLRALLGDEVEGRVDTSGRALALLVEHHGERESAALDTVKLLAFDLAAMTESMQGRGSFPRFLLHDGPREADMATDIYERLFLYARQLEACYAGEPGFQYIVTTTTRPPTEFLGEPWLRLQLAGAPAEQRLLRMDL